MANKIAWEDFGNLTGRIGNMNGVIRKLGNDFERLKSDKEAILDNTGRKAEVKKIVDEHPGFTVKSLGTSYTKLKALYDWLVANDYLS